MAQVQEIYDRIKNTKKEQQKIMEVYRDSLANSYKHQNVVEDLKALKEKKKQIEGSIQEDLKTEFVKLDKLKKSVEEDTQLLSDTALTDLIKGKEVEIFDENENQYVPIFSVKFKKAE
ncbi:hypothetical protein KAR26_01315 [Candidatus Parcubacteria bacterium]|nr:hypothetical protein [Candidatus Parcubacteria bacterium]